MRLISDYFVGTAIVLAHLLWISLTERAASPSQ